ncbi:MULTISPECIES: hypothetical protein [unclassified Streptomyces]|uniref:hypothetical protein n=1 Tax=unclassified Streptomyces TaxID=2593676 RepID=UPI00081E0543|nr:MULTISPECIES: hypothetical protein [unclassified Streptomyces]SCF62822.1 hypothetical protein GA0115259_1003415 [Streptomyces sp. MnatMP-M17]
MADIDPELMDERVAALDDKLADLLADIEATCVTWALGLAGAVERPASPEEA